ncbi:Transcription initiation factor TFIID subunit 9B [Clydaea vesicula]|uniref:Transcription initiation factor TFIID subunit 9B n=1 Tax=Clydaea vesicula TaxID=447962 RepID=A0AAD5UA35_9FUNG|nr:Transcription initiation factor TFIID subunit 9B [Clydaea vesicula]KAJ3397574.1 Transcription initiation factor TFIID subunit 9B [Lobulomyces angularis]
MTTVQDPQLVPKDAKLLNLLMEALGIKNYDPNCTLLLLQFMKTYTANLLQDAQAYAQHDNRTEIEHQDIQLAITQIVSSSFIKPPSKDFLTDLAEKKNAIPLPIIGEKFGIRCPPDRHNLTKNNFQILPSSEKTQNSTQSNSRPPNLPFLPSHQSLAPQSLYRGPSSQPQYQAQFRPQQQFRPIGMGGPPSQQHFRPQQHPQNFRPLIGQNQQQYQQSFMSAGSALPQIYRPAGNNYNSNVQHAAALPPQQHFLTQQHKKVKKEDDDYD